MKPEAEIQKWLERLTGKNGQPVHSGLYDVIRFGGSPLDVEMQNEVERYRGLSHTLPSWSLMPSHSARY